MTRHVTKLAAIAALGVPTAVPAHHSFAAHFDMSVLAEITGRVTSVEWVNPHTKIYIEDADGEQWEVEAGPVNLLARMGIEREFFNVGEVIRVRGNPARRDQRALWVANVLLSDNTELLVGPTAEPYWSAEAVGDASGFFEPGELGNIAERSVFRIWTPLISGMPRPREMPILTSEGERAQAAYGINNQLVGDCEVPGMPFAMMSPYPIELIARGDHILIRAEAYDLERIAYLEAPGSVPGPSPLGYSVARIEDDGLTIETSRIDYHSFGDLGPAQSRESHVSERFTLSDDGLELTYDIVVTDPVMLAQPWQWGGAFVYREGSELKRWNCGVE